jgi:hypothetical protein
MDNFSSNILYSKPQARGIQFNYIEINKNENGNLAKFWKAFYS